MRPREQAARRRGMRPSSGNATRIWRGFNYFERIGVHVNENRLRLLRPFAGHFSDVCVLICNPVIERKRWVSREGAKG